MSSYKPTYLGHHAASSNGTSFTNRHARKNNDISSEPTIFADMNFLTRLGSERAIANGRVQRMSAAIKVNIRSKECTSSNCDKAGINENAVDVDEYAFADPDVEPIVH